MSCQNLDECLPYFCLARRVRTFFFFVLGHCLRFGVGLVQNCLDDQLHPGSSGLQAHFSAISQGSYDFNILAVRPTRGEVHVLDELGMDEPGMGVYALAPEFNGRAWHSLTFCSKC